MKILCPSLPYCAKVRLKCVLTLLHHPEVRGGSSLLSPLLIFSHLCFFFFNPSLCERSFCSFQPLLGGNSEIRFASVLLLLSTKRNCPLDWVDFRLILIFLVTRRNFHFGSLLPEGMEIRLCASPQHCVEFIFTLLPLHSSFWKKTRLVCPLFSLRKRFVLFSPTLCATVTLGGKSIRFSAPLVNKWKFRVVQFSVRVAG